jgi:hypothetical protein
MISGLFLIRISADEWGPPVSRSVTTHRILIGWPRRLHDHCWYKTPDLRPPRSEARTGLICAPPPSPLVRVPHLRPLLSRPPHPLLLHEQDSLGRRHSQAAASPPPSSLVVVALSRSIAVFPSGTGYCLTSFIAMRRLQEPHWIVAVYPRCRHR